MLIDPHWNLHHILTCSTSSVQFVYPPLGGADFLVCKQWRQRFAVVEKNVYVIFTMAEAGWGAECVCEAAP